MLENDCITLEQELEELIGSKISSFDNRICKKTYLNSRFRSETRFQSCLILKIIFLVPPNELSNVNKTYIDISNGQKFELID